MTAGLRGEDSVAELCRREGINQNLHYRWSEDFLEASKSAWRAAPGQGFGLALGRRSGWYGYTGGLPGDNTANFYFLATGATIVAWLTRRRISQRQEWRMRSFATSSA